MPEELRSNIPIVDSHVHVETVRPGVIEEMLEQEAECGVESIGLLMLSMPASTYVNTNPEGLYAKWRHPEQVYLFGTLDYTLLGADMEWRLTPPLAEQVRRLHAMGCDGMKMLNGKPNYRKDSGLALDSFVYEPYFAALEDLGFPLLWHVGDPEEFWDEKLVPDWAKESGWFYDETFPSKEALYGECHRVLERHPKLKVIFAHFHFLANDLPRAAELMDRFPNVYFDLTPGTEMYASFTRQAEETREFFLKHTDRLIFGSDYMGGERVEPVMLVRRFLETEGEFSHADLAEPVRGIAMPEKSLRLIYGGNYRRLTSEKPRALDRALVLEELGRLAAIQDRLGAPQNTARFFASLIDGGIPSDWERESIFDTMLL